MNRRVCSLLSSLHFAPTQEARDNLLREGISSSRISVTGNTGIDSLFYAQNLGGKCPVPIHEKSRCLLLTAHRRENFGEPHRRIFSAIRKLLEKFPDLEMIYPLHPNPQVQKTAEEAFSRIPRVHLVVPLDYKNLVATMKRAHFVLTDSGGIQEEAPALGKPVVILRDET